MAEVADGTVVDGRYTIKGRIGSGGMADVYRAEDAQLGRDVALKVLHRRFARDQEFVERFRREASAAAGLAHPNVVNVFDRGEYDGTYYIAMEHLPGRTLKELIQDEAPLPQERAIDLAIQILRAASFAHRRGVIHRDFKPHNVMVGSDDRLKVTDFGIARAGASEMTETGSIMGTAQYLSPEQAQGQRVGTASDLYSIGVILYEMLAGRVPFSGESAVSIALKHVSEPPPPLRSLRPKINPRLEQAVGRALLKDPEQRYASAEEFIAALEEARAAIRSGDNGAGTTGVFPPVEPPYVGDEEEGYGRGARWPLVVLALVLLAVGLAAALWHPWTTQQVKVPAVTGQRAATATALLQRDGFKVRTHPVQSGTVTPGLVVAQHPPAGNEVDKGSTVLLDVSNGPTKTLIPVVANLPVDVAQQTLNASGFTVTTEQRPSKTVPKGSAIKTSPPASTPAPQGSRVTLFVSSGPPNVTVPGVVGLTKDSARTALQGLGFKVTTKQQNATAPKGQVIAENPSSGSSLPFGSTVQITVSKGPQQVTVVDVTKQPEAQARGTLKGLGLKVKVVKKTSATDPPGTVIGENPPGGTKVPKGSTVTLQVAQKQPTSGGTGPGGGTGGTNGQGGNGTGTGTPPGTNPPGTPRA